MQTTQGLLFHTFFQKRIQTVDKGLPPLGKCRPDHLKKEDPGPSTTAGGFSRIVIRITVEVTLGAGRKQEGGTSYSSAQSA